MPQKLPRSFYKESAYILAQNLIGKFIVHNSKIAKIVETEAYLGDFDLACHASKGKTLRTSVMYKEGGFAYVYLIYGIHYLFNIVCGPIDDPQAVLIRAAEPINFTANLSGPGLFSQNMGITRIHNGLDLTSEYFHLLDAPTSQNIIATPRIGIDFAKKWTDVPLRFLDGDSNYYNLKKIKFASKPSSKFEFS